MVESGPAIHSGASSVYRAGACFSRRGLSRLYGRVLEVRLATYTSCFRAYRRDALLDLEPGNGGFLGVTETLALLVELLKECS